MIDIIKLYEDFGISYQPGGHKHVSLGWVGIPCPFCSGHSGFHLGYCIDDSSKFAGRYSCWRCGGGKNVVHVLSIVLKLDENSIYPILKKYQVDGSYIPYQKKERKSRKECKLPSGTTELQKQHIRYLENRNFDPEKIKDIWKIKGTGPIGNFNHRIIIPIYHQNKLVSYQGRDITDKSKMKYKACPADLESREHKTCLYGLGLVKSDSVVICEGVTDVWRLGPSSVATFGIKFTLAQVKLLLPFKKIFILFDPELTAIEQAEKLANCLSDGNREVIIIDLKNEDPGEMNQNDADNLMKELL